MILATEVCLQLYAIQKSLIMLSHAIFFQSILALCGLWDEQGLFNEQMLTILYNMWPQALFTAFYSDPYSEVKIILFLRGFS